MNVIDLIILLIVAIFMLELLSMHALSFPFKLDITQNGFLIRFRERILGRLLRYVFEEDLIASLGVRRKPPVLRTFVYLSTRNLLHIGYLFLFTAIPFLAIQLFVIDHHESEFAGMSLEVLERYIIKLTGWLRYMQVNPFVVLGVILSVTLLGIAFPILESLNVNHRLLTGKKWLEKAILVATFLNCFTFYSTRANNRIQDLIHEKEATEVKFWQTHEEIYYDLYEELMDIAAEEIVATDAVVDAVDYQDSVTAVLSNLSDEEFLKSATADSNLRDDLDLARITRGRPPSTESPLQQFDEGVRIIPPSGILYHAYTSNRQWNYDSRSASSRQRSTVVKSSLRDLQNYRQSVQRTIGHEQINGNRLARFKLGDRFKPFIKTLVSTTYGTTIKGGISVLLKGITGNHELLSSMLDEALHEPIKKMVTDEVKKIVIDPAEPPERLRNRLQAFRARVRIAVQERTKIVARRVNLRMSVFRDNVNTKLVKIQASFAHARVKYMDMIKSTQFKEQGDGYPAYRECRELRSGRVVWSGIVNTKAEDDLRRVWCEGVQRASLLNWQKSILGH